MRSLFAILLAFFAFTAATEAVAADNSHRVAQAFFDVYVDEFGRRFLVDPDTGEIVGRAEPNRPQSRRERARKRRQQRRESRRRRLEREFDRLLGRRDNRRREQPRRRNLDRVAPDREIVRKPLKRVTPEEEVARLPGVEQPLGRDSKEQSSPSPTIGKPNLTPIQVASLQVVLDRAGFSPGVIDGKWGSNVTKALEAWQEARGREIDLLTPGVLEQQVAQSGGEVLTSYTISPADVAGPFVKSVPVDYAQKAQLKNLSYTSPVEMLAERFHMSQTYLRALNEGKNFYKAGTTIRVVAPGAARSNKVHYIVADKRRKQVRAYGRNGDLVAAYPATIGSAATPSPTGTHSVERIAVNPEYTYNPKINFQQGNNKKILRIPPGPNGPVGSVWIALSKKTYGIHGTPNPETIGKTNSHGCIRLTNWDALELAKLVQTGATVEFTE